MQSQLTNYVLMAIFFGVIVAVPVMWYLLGIKTYGTGDYHQP
jgi:nitrogen fixation protein FixH